VSRALPWPRPVDPGLSAGCLDPTLHSTDPAKEYHIVRGPDISYLIVIFDHFKPDNLPIIDLRSYLIPYRYLVMEPSQGEVCRNFARFCETILYFAKFRQILISRNDFAENSRNFANHFLYFAKFRFVISFAKEISRTFVIYLFRKMILLKCHEISH